MKNQKIENQEIIKNEKELSENLEIKEISKKKDNSKKKEISKESEKINFLESLNDLKIKESNYQEIHEKFMNESEISMIDSLEKISINNENIKKFLENSDNLKNFSENFEFIMIHRESRKIYYLFLYDKNNNQEIFIMKNDSIMKNKIYLLKFSQFFEIDSLKIHYIKNDRKNQSKEIIDRNSKEYEEKIKKYSSI